MKGNIFSWRIFFLIFVFSIFFTGTGLAQAQETLSVIINEVSPSGDWVELLNTTGNPVDLTGWKLSQLSNPNSSEWKELSRINLSGSILGHGLIVVSVPDINMTGDVVSLYNPSLDSVRVPFGALHSGKSGVVELYGSPVSLAPASNKTISYLDGVWSESNSSKGWFNNSSTWNTIVDSFCDPLDPCLSGVLSNIVTTTNPTEVSDLYFEKNDLGKIQFSGTVNLTDPETVNTLESISSKLDLGRGLISFSPDADSVLNNIGATLTMEGLPIGKEYSIADLTVKDELGVIINSDDPNFPTLSNFSADIDTGTLTFMTSHFTSFEVSTSSPDNTVPIVEIISPVIGSIGSGIVSISASSTDLESGVNRIIFYYSSLDNYFLIGQTTEVSAPQNYSIDWNTTPLGNGIYDLYAVSHDNEGNIATSSSINITIDNILLDSTPPTGEILSPIVGTVATTTINFEATAVDPESGVKKVEFFLDGGILIGSTDIDLGENIYSISWSPEDEDLASGEHYIYAKFYNNDNYATTTVYKLLNVDVTSPTNISLNYNPSGTTRDDVSVTVTTNRRVKLNGVGEATTTLIYLFTDNGSHTFNYVDEVGHLGTTIAIVSNIDRSAPIISGVTPVAGDYVNSDTTLTFSSTDFFDPLCQVDGLNWGSPCNNRSFGIIPGWGNVVEGPFTLTIKDTDSAGNVGLIDTTYIKDTIAPAFVSAIITSPTTINVAFNEDLETDVSKRHILSTDDFEVSVAGELNQITGLNENNGLITLNLLTPLVGTNPTVLLTINPVQPESIADLAGNVYTAKKIVNPSDGMSPEVISAVTSGFRAFILDFSEDLKSTILLGDFSVYVLRNGSTVALPIGGISYSDKRITVVLNTDVVYGDILHYSIRANSSVSDLAGNLLNSGVSFSDTVVNNLPAPTNSGGGGGGGGGGTSGYNIATTTLISEENSGGIVLGTSTYRFMNDLSWCMENNDVRELQLRLTREGYLKVPATGYFGPKTLAAVKAYQLDHKLPTTGYFGPLTRSAMNESVPSEINDLSRNLLIELKNILVLLIALKNQ